MKSRERNRGTVLALFALLVLGAGGVLLFLKGPLGEAFFWNGNPGVFAELAVVFAWLFVSLCLVPARGAGLLAAALGIGVFAWCHRAFTPLAVSGAYGGFLLLLGKAASEIFGGFGRGLGGLSPERRGPRLAAVSMILGSALWMGIVCGVSAFGFGGVGLWRAIAAALAVLLLLRELSSAQRRGAWRAAAGGIFRRACERSFLEGLAAAVILTCLLIQAGRMNVALDYDSLHYGLRSPFILDNGNGIYENLGNINVVYTYAKGLEILALPLSGTPTYGFVLAFNLWLLAAVIWLGYRIAAGQGGRGCGFLAAAVLAVTPGITNMAVTAKSDTATLLFQLLALESLLFLLGERDGRTRVKWLFAAAGACMVSYTLKPTSVVFSTAAVGFGVLYCAVSCLKERGGGPGKRERGTGGGSLRLLIFPAAAWIGVWARTYLLTGVPSTSVFTSVWELLGFEVRWPFAFSSIPNEGLSMGLVQGILHLIDRLIRMWFAPLGEDMDHVIIAWGTGLSLLGLLAAALYGRSAFRRVSGAKRPAWRLLYLELLLVSVLSVVSVYLLWQVDGNYFMLWYALTAVCASLALGKGAFPLKSGASKLCWSGIGVLLAVFQISVTVLTGWAGAVGFTPISLAHGGYYDHLAETRARAEENGRAGIWELLSSDPSNRVIAFGEHPQCLDFQCNVQSYYDVTGSGGNVVLVKTLDNFKDFLRYAEIDYIYAEAGHLEEGTREWDVLRYLVEDGSLTDIVYENGNMAARVSLDGTGYGPEEAAEAAEGFYQNIIRR